MALPSILLAPAGTSLFRNAAHPDLESLILSLQAPASWASPEAGVELNSLALLGKGHLDPDYRVHYFLSETEEGSRVGEILRQVIGPERVVLHTVKGLNPADPNRFVRRGLVQFASQMGQVLRQADPESCAIDATGGFKAQSGVAITLGHALQIPVYYRYESFPNIVTIPPLPVSLDANLWCEHASLFFELAEDLTVMNALPLSQRLLSLLDWQVQDDAYLVGLNATGAIFHLAMCRQWPAQARLQLPQNAKVAPDLRDLPSRLREILEQAPYVVGLQSVDRMKSTRNREGFFLRGPRLMVRYRAEGKKHLAWVQTTARGRAQRHACLADLLLRYYTNRQ